MKVSSLWRTLVRSRKLLAKSSDMGEREKSDEKKRANEIYGWYVCGVGNRSRVLSSLLTLVGRSIHDCETILAASSSVSVGPVWLITAEAASAANRPSCVTSPPWYIKPKRKPAHQASPAPVVSTGASGFQTGGILRSSPTPTTTDPLEPSVTHTRPGQ